MSTGIFEEIRQALNEVMSGRRYLIAEMEKLKKSIPEIGPTLQKVGDALTAMEAFGEIATVIKDKLEGIQGGINGINNMAVALENIRADIDKIGNAYLSIQPTLEDIRQSCEKQEAALAALNQAISQLGQLMGQILGKLG